MTRISPAPLTFAFLVAVLLAGPAASAAPTTWEVDKEHSTLLFRIKHADIGFVYGWFKDFSGTIVVDEENPAASSVKITAQVASVDTNVPKRDQHLRSPDFFNANQFPTLTFESTSAKKTDDGYTVEGNFTLHGVTKPVSIDMKKTGEGKDPFGNERIGFEGMLTIKRSDFGMDKMMKAVGDWVWITIAVEGLKK